MAEIPDDVLNDFADAKASESGNHLAHGRYTLDVTKFEYKKLYKSPAFLLHWVVVEAAPNQYGQAPTPVGSVVNETYKTGQEGAMGRLKSTLCKHLGKQDSDFDKAGFMDLMKKLASGANPLAGRRVKCDTGPYTIKKGEHAGKEMVRLNFESVPQTKEDMLARRAAIDSVKAQAAAAVAMPKPEPVVVAPAKPAPVQAVSDDDLPF